MEYKKILVIGDSASGKSTFSDKLGKKLGLSVYHLDLFMDKVGRENKVEIKRHIMSVCMKESWIIDGNAFTKDLDHRVEETEIVFIFNRGKVYSLMNHIKRCFSGSRVGSRSYSLNLSYFIPYIFFKFPKRKQRAKKMALHLGKEVIEFNNFKQSDRFLNELK